jgi:hypothetical protein
MEIDLILDEAYDRVGGEHMTGRDAQTARRTLNLLLIDLINRGVPLSTLDEVTVTVASSVGEYTVSSNIIDVMHLMYYKASSSVETRMSRMSLFQFKDIPKKDTYSNRATQYTVDRDRDNVVIHIWPKPDNSVDTLKFWAMTKIQDVTRQDQLVDLPIRFLPAVVSGLAFYLAMKLRPDDANLIVRLKQEYEETVLRALEEDRERSSFFTTPHLVFR